MFAESNTYFAEILVLIHLCAVCLATRFIQHPLGISIKEGYSVELSCKIRRLNEDQVVEWYRDNLILSEGTAILHEDIDLRFIVTSFPDGLNTIYVLQINPTIRSDAGIYTCVIVSSDGDIVMRSNNASVVISEIPQQRYPECKTTQTKILANDLVTLNCSTEIITPNVNLSWTVNDTSFSSETFSSGSVKTIKYTFRARKIDHRSVFMCVLNSDALEESRNCSIGPVNVLYKPTVKIHHTSNIVIVGREMFMVCHSDANPPVKDYKWQITPEIQERYIFLDESTQVLRLVNITSDQNNTIISCRAENEVGSETDQVKLYIQNEKRDSGVTVVKTATTPPNPANYQPNDGLSDRPSISLPLPIIITCAVTGLVLILITVVIPIYFLCICNRKQKQTKKEEESIQVPIDIIEMQEMLQPDYYFEPCDRVLPRIPDTDRQFSWRQHIGVQVPDDDYDVASTSYMYLTLNEPKRSRHIEQYRRYHTLNPMRL